MTSIFLVGGITIGLLFMGAAVFIPSKFWII